MRIAVVHFGGRRKKLVDACAQKLAAALGRRGFDIDTIDGDRGADVRWGMYRFIVVGTSATSVFRGKLDARVATLVGSGGTLGGKRAFAFVVRTAFGAQRALLRLMAILEHEGVVVTYSDVFASAAQVSATADGLKVEP